MIICLTPFIVTVGYIASPSPIKNSLVASPGNISAPSAFAVYTLTLISFPGPRD